MAKSIPFHRNFFGWHEYAAASCDPHMNSYGGFSDSRNKKSPRDRSLGGSWIPFGIRLVFSSKGGDLFFGVPEESEEVDFTEKAIDESLLPLFFLIFLLSFTQRRERYDDGRFHERFSFLQRTGGTNDCLPWPYSITALILRTPADDASSLMIRNVPVISPVFFTWGPPQSS